MLSNQMLAAVDEEIARLQLVRRLLVGESSANGHGVPSKVEKAKHAAGGPRRVMSVEARERIASAQRKRWAAARKAAKKAARQ